MSESLAYESRAPDRVGIGNPQCPKCGGSMVAGFTLAGYSAHRGPTRWIEGVFKLNFWSGLNLKKRLQFPIVSYRCHSCGYLESYAPDSSTTPE